MVASLCAAQPGGLSRSAGSARAQIADFDGFSFNAGDFHGAKLELAADRSGRRDRADRASRGEGASGRDRPSRSERERRGAEGDASGRASRAERRAAREAAGGGGSPTAANADVAAADDTVSDATATDESGASTDDDSDTQVDGPTPTPRDYDADSGGDDDAGADDGSGTGSVDDGSTGGDDGPTVVDGPTPTPRDESGDQTGGGETGSGYSGSDPTTDGGSTDGGATDTGGADTGGTGSGGTGSGTGGSTTGGGTSTGSGTGTGTGTDVAGSGGTGSSGSGTSTGGSTGGSSGSGSGATGGDSSGSAGSGSSAGGGTSTAGGGSDTTGGTGTGTNTAGSGDGSTGGGSTAGNGSSGGEAPATGGESGGNSGSPTTVAGGGGDARTGSGTSVAGSAAGGGATSGTSAPSLVDIVKSIFSGSHTTKTVVRNPATATAATPANPVVVAPVVAPVAPVVAPPVVAAPVAKGAKAAVVEVEPKAAATAPRIQLSSGGSDETYRRYEITALGLTPHSRQVLGALGFKTLSEHRSPLLGNRIVARLRTPGQQTADAALSRARQALPEMTFDYAHLYRPSGEQTPVRYAANMIGAPTGSTCPVNARVGLIDSGVANHETLANARIVRKNFVEKGAATNVAHGTAIASILVGDLPGSGPLLPSTQLYSANVFAQDGAGGVRADATAIIAALDWMAAQKVPVVNLSLMGQSNALLEQAIRAAASRGLVLVAAAGNEGPSAAPAYPAGYPGVIAVAAVDARGRPYGNNNRGSYIYVAAPGVDIWGADARGGLAFWTGTSFAAPFVTATLARDIALGRTHNVNDGRARIASSARDLGAPGRDPIYGFGLLQSGGCGGSAPPVLSSKR